MISTLPRRLLAADMAAQIHWHSHSWVIARNPDAPEHRRYLRLLSRCAALQSHIRNLEDSAL